MQTTPTPKGSANRPPPGRPPVLPPAPPSGSTPATPVSPVSTYWAVFRLTDALPAELGTRLRAEEEEANRTDGGDESTLRRRIAQRIEAELNAGHGDCWLRDEQVARLVQSALQAGHGRRYTLRAWSVLPNHLHVIFTAADGVDPGAVVREWRSYTTSQVNLALDRGAVELWERVPYLRALEDEAEVMRRIRNVEFRAVNAGLCRRPRDWKWSSAHESAPAPPPRGGGGNASPAGVATSGTNAATPPATSARPVVPPRPRPG
jgi:putative transposase